MIQAQFTCGYRLSLHVDTGSVYMWIQAQFTCGYRLSLHDTGSVYMWIQAQFTCNRLTLYVLEREEICKMVET